MDYELNKYHRNTSDVELINDLKRVASDLGKTTVTQSEYNKLGKYHATTLTRRYGSWFKCLELAQLSLSRSPINIPEEELFQNLAYLWEKFGRQPKYSEVKKPISEFSVGTYEKRYGTFYKALEKFVMQMNGEIVDRKYISNLKVVNNNPRAINYRTRFLIMRRDNFKCRICGASPSIDPSIVLHVDHVVPCAKGGTANFENLQTLCSRCNLGKSDLNM